MVNRLFDRGPLSGMWSPNWSDVSKSHWAYNEIEEASREHFYVKHSDGEIIIDGSN